MPRKIVTACGLACSMAPLIAGKIKERLSKEGITDVEVVTAKIPELASVAKGAVCVVTSVKVYDDLGVPVINGAEFVMGLPGTAALDKVVAVLRK
jgi:galactitol-specific phosphotransferase system IIB component